jgi:heat shock protein HslJ
MSVLGFLVVMVQGCAGPKSGAGVGFVPATAEKLAAWQDADLQLVRMVEEGEEVALPADPAITLRLMPENRVAGRSAVNRYAGTYMLSVDGGLTWQGVGLAMTRMAGPPEAMELEGRYARLLTATTQVEVSGEALRFSDRTGKVLLEFRR